MIKQWLILGSIAFGVGFGVGFSFNRDPKQAAFSGLAAIPATSATLLFVECQRRKQGNSLEALTAETRSLAAQKQNLAAALLVDTETSRQLNQQISDLHTESSQLQSSIVLYQEGCDLHLIVLLSNRKAILVKLIPELIPSSWR